MPLHDWTRVDAGTYHDFHQGWAVEIRNALNRGLLPDGFVAAIAFPGEDATAVQRKNRIVVRRAGGDHRTAGVPRTDDHRHPAT